MSAQSFEVASYSFPAISLTNAAAMWATSKGLTAKQRATFCAIRDGRTVTHADGMDACIAALGANATRFGQSMARRRGRQAVETVLDYVRTLDKPTLTAVPEPTSTAVSDFVASLLTDAQKQRVTDFTRGFLAAKIEG